MKSEVDNKASKRVYEKPALRVIDLAADEVLSPGCKNAPAVPGIGTNLCTNGSCQFTNGS